MLKQVDVNGRAINKEWQELTDEQQAELLKLRRVASLVAQKLNEGSKRRD